MTYRLHPEDDGLAGALRRIAASELAAALAHLPADNTVTGAGVHDIRKRVKKLRGLLRLLRPGLAAFAAENAALREAAQGLSTLRDSAVRLATFDRLFPDPGAALSPLRQRLAAEAATAATAAAPVAETRARLAAIASRVPDWTLKGKDGTILTAGLARTRSQARAALAFARTDPNIEAIHTWRKRAKDHWYQARLLTPVWPEVLTPIASALSALTEDLGDHHDLAVLAAHATTLAADLPEALSLVIQSAAEARQDIETRAFPQGARLFAGEPEAMARLWTNWWRGWRAGSPIDPE